APPMASAASFRRGLVWVVAGGSSRSGSNAGWSGTNVGSVRLVSAIQFLSVFMLDEGIRRRVCRDVGRRRKAGTHDAALALAAASGRRNLWLFSPSPFAWRRDFFHRTGETSLERLVGSG